MRKNDLVRKITSWMTLGVFAVQPTLVFAADIVADASAPEAQRPYVTETANGIPLVQIARPDGSDVSVNRYDAFSVPERGAILNNAFLFSNTQLAGYIEGNPNLSGGPARIIVNEVMSDRPSELRGYLEVAGTKADIIIANPNGIYADGAGFLNASRTILAAGHVLHDAGGGYTGLRIEDGRAHITGKGLDARGADSAEIYEEQNKSAGFGISWGVKAKDKQTSTKSTGQTQNPPTTNATKSTPKPNNTKVPAPTTGRKFFAPTIGASWNKGNIDSHYRSAREQAGFFAGSGGFDIYVEKNTNLKGGVIASNATPDKNHLSTGTLSFSDLKNEADYSAKSIGASYHKYGNYKNMEKEDRDAVYNTIGLAPNISMPVKGDASSTTKSAVAAGTIDIRENPAQDISALSRNTANSLNELGKIFDKAKIEEQQELAAVFGEEAFRLLHNMRDDGSGRKIAAHAIIGGLMSQITGAGFASGAIGAGLNEALIKALDGKDPGTAQLISAIIGAAAAKAIGGNAQAGASTAASGTKWNYFLMEFPDMYPVETIAKETLKKKDGKTPSPEEISQYIEGMHRILSEQEPALANSAWKQAENTDNYPKAIRYLMDAGVTKESAINFFKKYNETLRSSNWEFPESVAVEDGYWNRDVLVSKKTQSSRHSTSNVQQYERVTEMHPPKEFDGTNLVLPEKEAEFSLFGSIGINSATDVSNHLPAFIKFEGHFVRPLSLYLNLGGVVGIGWTYRDMRQDWYTYSGTNLTQALIADTIPTIFSAGGAALSGASGGASGLFYGAFGGIAGATIGDLIKYEIKKNISKDMQNK